VVLCQEVEFVLAPGQELYQLKFDVIFANNIALSYFIGEISYIRVIHNVLSHDHLNCNTIGQNCITWHLTESTLQGLQPFSATV